MKFSYASSFGGPEQALDPYERLIHDVMVDDRTLFTNSEAIERLWEISQPALDEPPPLRLRARLNRALGDGRSDRTARLARPARSHLTSSFWDAAARGRRDAWCALSESGEIDGEDDPGR